MVVQQAMAAKVPVVATDICGIPDHSNMGGAGCCLSPGTLKRCRATLACSCRTRSDGIRLSTGVCEGPKRVRRGTRRRRTIDFYEEVLRDSVEDGYAGPTSAWIRCSDANIGWIDFYSSL